MFSRKSNVQTFISGSIGWVSEEKKVENAVLADRYKWRYIWPL